MDNSYVQEFKRLYLSGLPLNDDSGDVNGFTLTDEDIQAYLEYSMASVETGLNIKLNLQEIEEDIDAYQTDLTPLVKIKTTFPVRELTAPLEGWWGNYRYLSLPVTWLKVNKNNYGQYLNSIYVVPNTGQSANFYGPLYMGSMGMNGINIMGISPGIPGFWRVKYTTGFDQIPDDIVQFIYMDAAISILPLIGDMLYGVGTSNEQLSLDDLRQNVYKQQGQYGAFSPRVNAYIKKKDALWKNLRAKYRGVRTYII